MPLPHFGLARVGLADPGTQYGEMPECTSKLIKTKSHALPLSGHRSMFGVAPECIILMTHCRRVERSVRIAAFAASACATNVASLRL